MIKKRSRDWFKILRDLMKAGISMHKVGRVCGRTVQAVAHWGDGGEPKDSDARVVLALYKQHCPDQYKAHMEEFEGDVLQFQREVVYVKPDNSIRGRPKPRMVAVSPSQFDFFVTEAA